MMGPNYACLFVGFIEEQIRTRYTGFVPQLHKRYIDNVVRAAQCSQHDLEDYIDYVSNFHPAIQFTSTISELELPFLDIQLRINNNKIQTSVHYKETDTHNYLHHTSLHPDHGKQATPYNQFLQLRRICSDDDDFITKATEMKNNFRGRGYPQTQLDDLLRVSNVPCDEALTLHSQNITSDDRVPLVLTYNQFNIGTRRIMIHNYNILSSDPETRTIFPTPPLVSYRGDRNLRDIPEHSADGSPSDVGTLPCHRPRCQTCKYITPLDSCTRPQEITYHP